LALQPFGERWLQCLHTKGRFDMFNALDLRKVTDAVQEFSHFDDDVLDSWERIKKSLEGVQTQPTNSRKPKPTKKSSGGQPDWH